MQRSEKELPLGAVKQIPFSSKVDITKSAYRPELPSEKAANIKLNSNLTLLNSQTPENLNFLDLNLSNTNGHVDVKLYDKRNNFPFSIVHLPFSSSNKFHQMSSTIVFEPKSWESLEFLQILKILNQHHSKLIQTTVNNELNQSMMSNASSLKSTNDDNSDKENIFKGAKVEINLVDNNAKYNKEQFSFGSSKLNQVNNFL